MKARITGAFTLIEIMIVVAIIGLLAAVAVPNLKQAIDKARLQACAINRQQIDAAKLRWALETKQPATATPEDKDLFGPDAYVEHKPDCPAGGAYTLSTVEQKCTCSVPKHAN